MNILLTAIGSMSALCAITRLKTLGHKVVGCDIFPQEWHYEASICDSFAQAPRCVDQKAYVAFLIDLAFREQISHIMPLTDREIDVLNDHRDIFTANSITLCMPDETTLKTARDKWELHRMFDTDPHVSSVPTSWGGADLSNITYPCIGKPRDGRSSEGLMRLTSPLDLNGIPDKGAYIFQEIISGPVCTVDVVRDPITRKIFSVAREELLRTKNGAGTAVRIFNDEKLKNLVCHIADKLNIKGVVNMEFILDGDGDYHLIDINPRFSAGIAFSCRTGYDFIAAHLACFSGTTMPADVAYEEHIDVKYFTEPTL